MKRDKRSPLARALQNQIDFWASTDSDPHQIANAVLTALHCVQDAVIETERATAKKGNVRTPGGRNENISTMA